MKHTLNKIASKLLDIKIYLNRTTSYVYLANTGMILIILLTQLRDYGINIPVTKYAILIYVTSLIIFSILGWLDIKLGLYKSETSKNQAHNPEIQKILEKLEKIEQKIK